MNQVEIYKNMRLWENMTNLIKEAKTELRGYSKGTKEVINTNFFSLEEETVESRIELRNKEIQLWEREKEEISVLLSLEGVDVEYVVTEARPHLKVGGWLHNYYIRKHKKEKGDYYYTAHEQDMSNKEFEVYVSLEDAVTEVLSYYYYLDKIETLEEAILKLDF